MKNGNGKAQVAPHGIICLAALAMLIILGIHALGFRAMAAVKVG